MELFRSAANNLPGTPLPEKLRPQEMEQILGQKEAAKIWQQILKTGQTPSLILWGPPGTGKTSFALAMIRQLGLKSEIINAIEVGTKSLREIGQTARDHRLQFHQQTVVFIDEIHRLNKAQQDVLLPFVERGEFVLIGATTENPSYDLNRALLSRCQLVVFEGLSGEVLTAVLEKAIGILGFSLGQTLAPEAQKSLLEAADGDARKLLSMVERLQNLLSPERPLLEPLSVKTVEEILGSRTIGYDRQSDQHYDTISAFIKSIRGSDADAGLYYLARVLKAGENPILVARRLVILASEDIGNADPRALTVAVAAAQAVELVGLPEAAINLAQAVTYLASAPKSNRSYRALKSAQEAVERTGTLPIPLHLRSSKTGPMLKLGYGVDYKNPHDYPRNFVPQNYLPEGLNGPFYEPSERGFEKQMMDYLKWLKAESKG
jgi:putative ATPase